MNPKSVEFLRDYNDWRRSAGRYASDEIEIAQYMPNTRAIGDAIDWACEQIERMQWRPIETAPKDGTIVLVFAISEGDPYDRPSTIAEAWWGCGGETLTHWAGIGLTAWHRPTHWIPIPPPPGETKLAVQPNPQ